MLSTITYHFIIGEGQASRRAELESGDLLISEYRIEDLRIEMYGNTAVVTGVVFSSGSRKGEKFDSQVRFTNVWVFQGGSWRRAAFHDSPVIGQ